MKRLTNMVFQAQVNSRIQDRSRRGLPTDFNSVAGELLDSGLVPMDKRMWDWARQLCGETAA